MKWHLVGSPLPVQKVALEMAEEHDGYGFFLEPGMGKTAICMSEFTSQCESGNTNLLVVICPNTLRSNWATEADKFGFKYDVAMYPDPPPAKGMWIINYEKLITKGFDEIYKVMSKRKCYIVADESHRIKNPKAKSTKAAISLFDLARVKRVMTGTPMANNVVDLWSQMRCIGHNGIHRNPYTWRNRYGVMGGWMGKVVVGVQREDELKKLLDEHSFQAKKRDWMKTLPPKAYYTLDYEMNAAQKKAYNQIYKDRFMVIDDQEITAQIVITALMKMQQITSGFMMDDDGKTVDLVGWNNPKINAIVDAVGDIKGKIILFAHYRNTIDLLYSRFGNEAVKIVGGMKREDIENVKKAFNTNDEVRYLIAQTSTAKEGLTLLGTEKNPCHTTIFVENTYSLIDRTQAEDRNHRHGQVADQVSYYDLVGSKIESRIIKALQDKKDLVKSVLEGTR